METKRRSVESSTDEVAELKWELARAVAHLDTEILRAITLFEADFKPTPLLRLIHLLFGRWLKASPLPEPSITVDPQLRRAVYHRPSRHGSFELILDPYNADSNVPYRIQVSAKPRILTKFYRDKVRSTFAGRTVVFRRRFDNIHILS